MNIAGSALFSRAAGQSRRQVVRALLFALGAALCEGVFVFFLHRLFQNSLHLPVERVLPGLLIPLAALSLTRLLFLRGWQATTTRWISNWITFQWNRLRWSLHQTRAPIYREFWRKNLRRHINADFQLIFQSLSSGQAALLAAMQILIFLPLFFLFPASFILSCFVLAFPVALLSKWRIHYLSVENEKRFNSEKKSEEDATRFSWHVETLLGTNRMPQAMESLNEQLSKSFHARDKWEIAQGVFPHYMETFFFLTLATAAFALHFFFAGDFYGSQWQFIPLVALLLFLYKPIREVARHYPRLLPGEEAWMSLDKNLITLENRTLPSPVFHEGSLRISDLSFSYEGENPREKGVRVFQDLRMELKGKGPTGILGPNGSGKTTLFRLIFRLEYPQRGVIHYPVEWKSSKNNLSIAYLPQNVVVDSAWFSFFHTLEKSGDATWASIEDILSLKELLNRAEMPTSSSGFSLGEQRRLALAYAFCLPAQCLLLDEPTTWLPGSERKIILTGLLSHWMSRRPRGMALVATHEPELTGIFQDTVELEPRTEERC